MDTVVNSTACPTIADSLTTTIEHENKNKTTNPSTNTGTNNATKTTLANGSPKMTQIDSFESLLALQATPYLLPSQP